MRRDGPVGRVDGVEVGQGVGGEGGEAGPVGWAGYQDRLGRVRACCPDPVVCRSGSPLTVSAGTGSTGAPWSSHDPRLTCTTWEGPRGIRWL